MIKINNPFKLKLILKLRFNRKLADQVLRKKQQPFIPQPIGIWPLSKASLTEESTSDMMVQKNNIGIDLLWSPAGFIGSPLISPLPSLNSFIIADYKTPIPSWPGITVLFWLRFDDEVMPTQDNLILVNMLLRDLKVLCDLECMSSCLTFAEYLQYLKPKGMGTVQNSRKLHKDGDNDKQKWKRCKSQLL